MPMKFIGIKNRGVFFKLEPQFYSFLLWSKIGNVQVSDTTGDAISTVANKKIIEIKKSRSLVGYYGI
jgi:hypothetical protein